MKELLSNVGSGGGAPAAAAPAAGGAAAGGAAAEAPKEEKEEEKEESDDDMVHSFLPNLAFCRLILFFFSFSRASVSSIKMPLLSLIYPFFATLYLLHSVIQKNT